MLVRRHGVSRSATVILAWLMASESKSVTAAMAQLASVRPQCRPNPGFWRQLNLFQVTFLHDYYYTFLYYNLWSRLDPLFCCRVWAAEWSPPVPAISTSASCTAPPCSPRSPRPRPGPATGAPAAELFSLLSHRSTGQPYSLSINYHNLS